MWCVLLVGQLWLVMCMIMSIVKWWLLWFVTCNLRKQKFNNSCGQILMKWCWNTCLPNQNLRDSWLITHKPIGALLELFMVMGTLMLGWLKNSASIYSIGLSCSISTPNYSSDRICNINTTFFDTNIRNAKSLVEVNGLYVTIYCWWFSLGAISKASVHELANWLIFWHFCVKQWGGFMVHVNILPSKFLSFFFFC